MITQISRWKSSVSSYQNSQFRKWVNKIHQSIGSSVPKTDWLNRIRWTNAQWTTARFTTARNRNNDRYLLVRKNPPKEDNNWTNLQLYPAIPSKLAEEQLQSRTGSLYDFSGKFRFHCRPSPPSSVENFPISSHQSQWSGSVNLDRIHSPSLPPPTAIRYLGGVCESI